MDHFNYRDGELWCEGVSAASIAAAAGTPCYVYSAATLREHFDRLRDAFAPLKPLICFSIKSCPNLHLIRLLAERGAGMDLVSGGELHRALIAGVDPQDCVFAGVGKSSREIAFALEQGVGWLNVESEAEFENIQRVARGLRRTCCAALRVNPDVDPETHRYTTTGKRETKFGVDIERAKAFFERYGNDPHARLRGIHLHLGSPIYSPEPYVSALEKVLPLIDELESRGHRIDMLDLGGGFGADYVSDQTPLAAKYAEAIIPHLEDRVRGGLRLVLEPGRTICANAGVLLVGVEYLKQSGERTFVIADGGMNVLMRPSHYDAFHFIWPCRVAPEHVPPQRARELELPGLVPADVVGPICETGDFLGLNRSLPPLARGDVLCVFGAGAYGMAMANHYNAQPLPPEILVDGERVMVIRQRETFDDLTRAELTPRPLAMPVVARA